MSKLRNPYLWATASSVALGGTPGLAADMAVKAPPPPPPVVDPAYNWTGFYAGLNLGGATHYATTNDLNYYSGVPPANYVTTWFSSNKSAVTFGGQAGYNLQINNVVVGVEADINYIGAKTTFAPALTPQGINNCCAIASATNELDWLATFRGRIGIPIQHFLIYGTGGLALGQISNSWGFGSPGPGGSFSPNQFSVNQTRAGVVYGGGIEYAAWGHWIARAEALYVDLGTTNAINPRLSIRSWVHLAPLRSLRLSKTRRRSDGLR